MKFRVFRYKEGDASPHYDIFEVRDQPGMTVLSALFFILENLDPTLAFRSSCRGAVCGTCAMLINKVPRLACRTQVRSLHNAGGKPRLSPYPALEIKTPWDYKTEVLIEPLPHLPVIRDLMVDMDPFFSFLRETDPVFHPSSPVPDKEYTMDQSSVNELERYTNCILCGACFGACPVNSKNSEYPGPAALATLFRFHIDPREGEPGSRLATADSPSGWWACEFHTNCTRVCPKGVPPSIAIGKARKELQLKKNSGR